MASYFLSCLCGSEHQLTMHRGYLFFLSCLCGSEHKRISARLAVAFLSCLCGSELSGCIVRALPLFSKLPVRQ